MLLSSPQQDVTLAFSATQRVAEPRSIALIVGACSLPNWTKASQTLGKLSELAGVHIIIST
jgi:hypothetical protein